MSNTSLHPVITLHACARGKVIRSIIVVVFVVVVVIVVVVVAVVVVAVVVVVVHTKIARSQDLGI